MATLATAGMYVLIVFTGTGNDTQIVMHDFSSEKACDLAKQVIDINASDDSRYIANAMPCVPK